MKRAVKAIKRKLKSHIQPAKPVVNFSGLEIAAPYVASYRGHQVSVVARKDDKLGITFRGRNAWVPERFVQ